MRFSGRAWRLGDNIDTDVIAPGKLLQLGAKEIAKHTLKTIRTDLAPGFARGDLLLAGKNFGCGSSRELAPRALIELGVSVVVAQSFARIFYRNCLAIGLPLAILSAPADFVADRDSVEVDLVRAQLSHPQSGQLVALRETPVEMLRLLEKGGIVPLIEAIGREQQAQGKESHE